MTHSTVNTEPESGGSTGEVCHTIDITRLDSAGVEQYDPGSELGIEGGDRFGVDVRGQADGTYDITWDHVNEQLVVKEVNDTGDGTGGTVDVAAGTAVGQVLLHVTGV
jgi:hypothetical protein